MCYELNTHDGRPGEGGEAATTEGSSTPKPFVLRHFVLRSSGLTASHTRTHAHTHVHASHKHGPPVSQAEGNNLIKQLWWKRTKHEGPEGGQPCLACTRSASSWRKVTSKSEETARTRLLADCLGKRSIWWCQHRQSNVLQEHGANDEAQRSCGGSGGCV